MWTLETLNFPPSKVYQVLDTAPSDVPDENIILLTFKVPAVWVMAAVKSPLFEPFVAQTFSHPETV